jgi:hypothetical protein
MLRQTALGVFGSLSMCAVGAAQESSAYFDAPVVEFGPLDRIEQIVELDGTPGIEALSWWWESSAEDAYHVRCWDRTETDFELLWDLTLNNLSSAGGPGGTVLLVPAALDGSAKDDLITINNRRVRVHLGGRTGAPVLIQSWGAAAAVTDAFATDLDGDGFDELILVDTAGRAVLHENGGAAANWNLATAPQPALLGAVASRVQLAELTGDQTADLFYVRDDAIAIQPIAPDLTFPAEVSFPLAAPYFTPNPATGDIDGDGDDDAVVFALDPVTLTGIYTVLRRDGPSAFLHESLAVGGPATNLVDLDGDGDLDGACCGGGGGGPINPFKWQNIAGSTFELCHNDGTGGFTPTFKIRGLGASRLAGAVDIDFDGDVDLIAGRAIYYAPGPITAAFETVLSAGEHQGKLFRDWDGDGDPDLRAGFEEVRRSDGTGHVEAMTPAMEAPVVPGLEFKGPGYAGDFDGDGDDDLIVAKFKDGTFRRMRLLANTGGGQLEDGGDCSDPAVGFSKTGNDYVDPRGGWAVDIEPDGDVDLFTWDPDKGTIQSALWLNDGTGYFHEATSFQAAMYARLPQVAVDFNGDQNRDLILTSFSNGRPFLYLGDGSGGYSSGNGIGNFNTRFRGQVGSIAVGDFDDDGDKDFVVNNQEYQNSMRVVMFAGDGAGNFSEINLGVAGPFWTSAPGGVTTADVNGDGWSDVIASSLSSGESAAAILLRNPSGVMFRPAIQQVLDPLQSKDVDGDGDHDLVDASFRGVPGVDDRIVMNRRVEGASSGWRRQIGEGVAGGAGFTPTLGARTFGGYAAGDSLKFLLTGAAPGATGRLVITELGTLAASPYTVTSSGWGTLPPDRDVTKNVVRVIDFVTSGDPGDAPGTGKWDTRDVIRSYLGGRTFLHRVEIDDPLAPTGLAETNELYVRYAD